MRISKQIPLIASVIFALFIGATSFMAPAVYASAWWLALWVVVLAVLLWSAYRVAMWRRPLLMVIHLSMAIIIVGGICTRAFSTRGTLHLEPSVTTDRFVDAQGVNHALPAALTLVSFNPEYYRGMSVPRDFVSVVAVAPSDTMRISMNNIGEIDGYRFYQTSFDDHGGTILTVSRDPWGIAIVYLGFAIFAIAGGLLVLKNLRAASRSVVLVTLAISAADAHAIPAVPASLADSLASRQVRYNGEVVPFSTVATRLTYKLTGRGDVAGLSPEAFVLSLVKYRDEWIDVPFLKVKSAQLRDSLNAQGKYVAVSHLYDANREYIPGKFYHGGEGGLDSDILALDERVALLSDLWSGELFEPLMSNAPDSRKDIGVAIEVCYNKTQPVRLMFILAIVTALLAGASTFTRYRRFAPRAISTLAIAGVLVVAWQWSTLQHHPLTTITEMTTFTSVVMLVVAAIISHRHALAGAISTFASAFLLLVTWLGIKDPAMTPVMPVLASPWLSVHVSIIMASYAILSITMPLAAFALILPRQRSEITRLSLTLLIPGTWLLAIGIIIGAMWANVSWGRYWAWDPKETWALVTLMLYAIPLHRSTTLQQRPVACNIHLIFAFAAILMTYFGVNYLPSMHAYQ